MKKKAATHSAEETSAIAERLARHMKKGGVIGLIGDLGAGKTVFVKGMAKGFGVKHLIQSPTFVLMKVYPIKHRPIHRLVHVDCYRLKSVDDLRDIGLEDYLHDPSAVVVIEWADKVRELLPKRAVLVSIDAIGEHERKIIIE